MLSLLFSHPIFFLIAVFSLLVAITIHEFAHAYVADHLGDPTPRLHGRVTLNPFVHIDPFGLLFLFLAGFGWGRPVMFDPYNLKNPRRDAALISIAGPMSNFILAILLSILLRTLIFFNQFFFSSIGFSIISIMIDLNVVLGLFNLLPIHPLDGFKIVGGILPEDKAREWYELERYGLIFLILLLIPIGNSSLVSGILSPLKDFVTGLLLPTIKSGIM